MSERGPRRWLSVDLEVRDSRDLPLDEAAGACSAALTPLGCLGLEVHEGEPPWLRAYFPPDTALASVALALESCGVGSHVREARTLEDAHWVEEWNKTLHPIDVGGRLTILPAGGEAPPGRIGLHVVPGRAFGTGHHASTRLALHWLDELVEPGASVLDVGTGSGILALAAARLGASRVVATDDDPEAIEVAGENLAMLPERDAVRLRCGPGLAGERGLHDVVVANITSDVILPLLPELVASLAPGGHLVLSGLLGVDERSVEAALHALGWTALWRREGEWSAALAGRPRA